MEDTAFSVFRGRGGESLATRRIGKRGGQFESLRPLPGQKPGDAAKSIEGWVLFVSGLPVETLEGDLMDIFAPIGIIRNIRMNTDQRESKCIGHAMIEFEHAEECARAVNAWHGKPFLSSPCISVSEAFVVEEEEQVEVKTEGMMTGQEGEDEDEEKKRKRRSDE